MAVSVTDVPTVVDVADTPSDTVVAVALLVVVAVLPEPPQPATTLPTAPAPNIRSAARRSSEKLSRKPPTINVIGRLVLGGHGQNRVAGPG